MPNLQSTGTDANHTVNPQSPDDANSSFDALIDLLASDDIHDIAVAGSHPHPDILLRDASGKLAFDKIRLMFATKNLGPERIDNKSPDIRPDTYHLDAQHANDIQDVFHTSHYSSPDELVRTRSDEQEFLSRASDEPNAQITIINSLPRDKIPLPHQDSSTEKVMTRPTDLAAPLTESSSLHAGTVKDFTGPLDFEKLNSALSHATSEIHSLRDHYEKLRTLVTERHLPPNGLQTEKPSAQPSGNHTIPLYQAQGSDLQRGLEPAHLEEISNLSEYEAKDILAGLITSLRLSPRSVRNLVSKFLDEGPICPHPSSVDDVRSSMEFLARIDELVWKRSVPMNGDGPDPLYSRANTDALVQRLALWEKIIRAHHKG
ncbi:uncharacterized protein HD556DRAFT_1474660 [Suillus plorans]|uniref:Uncharacterized protein n=1 Tax=Suillus plorans TaxID=116603 RepID=A0A9P7DI68_9AGAM|nr:uncharacterized protein HD556DRAFT_1474660 [Suillus plorans]KAG1794566.1 hypothetical protein HD556DRAFT_1474660 [Suillus plorans]